MPAAAAILTAANHVESQLLYDSQRRMILGVDTSVNPFYAELTKAIRYERAPDFRR